MTKLKLDPACIYCGVSRSFSKEHVIADWIEKYIPRRTPKFGIRFALSKNTMPAQLAERTKWSNGDLGTRKIRKVCLKCNNEWMSQLQTASEQHLAPLLLNRWSGELSFETMRAIAKWATMTTINLASSGDHPLAADDRRYFFEHRQPPAFWRFFIGRTRGDSLNFMQRSAGIHEQPLSNAPHNSHIITVQLASLVLQTVVIPRLTLVKDWTAYSRTIGMHPFALSGAEQASIDLAAISELDPAGVNKAALFLMDQLKQQINGTQSQPYNAWP